MRRVTRRKRLLKPSSTGFQRPSRCTTLVFEQVLVKPIYRVASSKRDDEAGPGSKHKAGYKEPSQYEQYMPIGGPGNSRPQF
jgi:hypothetical protein